MAKILILEDSKESMLILESVLSHHDLHCFEKISEATNNIKSSQYDLIILDRHLPDGDATEIIPLIHKFQNNTAIFILTADDKLTTKIEGFQLGADDFISKPFIPLELKARVDAKVKKLSKVNLEKNKQKLVLQNLLEIDNETKSVFLTTRNTKEEIQLTKTEFEILHYLVSNDNLVKSREQILDFVFAGLSNTTDRTIDAHISKIRRKLDRASICLQSVHGYGYKFNSAAYKEAA